MVGRAQTEARALAILVRAGMVGVERPSVLAQIVRAVRAYGPFAASSAIGAAKHGDHVAIIDDAGAVTYREMEAQVNQLVRAWQAMGLRSGTTIGILCRNGRTPLIAAFAAGRLGARCVWLNSEFSPPQCHDVCRREGVDHIVLDEELLPLIVDLELSSGHLVTTTADPADDALAAACREQDSSAVGPPDRPGSLVLLTSGTTGTPKGAARREPRSLVIPAAFIGRLGLRSGEVTIVVPPLFHGTGLGPAMFTLALGGKIVVHRRFDAEQCLIDIDRHRAGALILVPVLLKRILALGIDEITACDHANLHAIMCGGSRLGGSLATAAMDAFGDVVFNLYGSTEAALGTMATPKDLRAAPDCVGTAMLGTRVRILDGRGHVLPAGETGRIFIAASSPFEGYTGGGTKEVIDGYMSTGDLGHLDAAGRLFIDGRDDEMIVSGGENVFPGEVEDTLIAHPEVAEAAVVGVPDEEFGERLAAFVVLAEGAATTEESLRLHVRSSLARYKVPRDVFLVGELPRTATGKVRKSELAAQPEQMR